MVKKRRRKLGEGSANKVFIFCSAGLTRAAIEKGAYHMKVPEAICRWFSRHESLLYPYCYGCTEWERKSNRQVIIL